MITCMLRSIVSEIRLLIRVALKLKMPVRDKMCPLPLKICSVPLRQERLKIAFDGRDVRQTSTCVHR